MPDIKKDNPNPNIEKGDPGKDLDTEKDIGKRGMDENQDVEDLGRKQGFEKRDDSFGKQGSSEDKGYTK